MVFPDIQTAGVFPQFVLFNYEISGEMEHVKFCVDESTVHRFL